MKTQMAAVGFWLGAKGGGVGEGPCIQLRSKEPSSQSEVVNREDAEKDQFQHGMDLES